jgi:diaminopimelate decarboxylase
VSTGFGYRQGRLHAEGVDLEAVAQEFGTPCYVYSRGILEARWREFDRAFGDRAHLVCYAVKASSNLAVLEVLARLGSGFDIVSGGELERVLAAGGDAGRVMFSGVGKTRAEMTRALEVGVRCFNVESVPELDRLAAVAAGRGQRAPVSLRVNPDVDPETHPYIATGLRDSKFGIPIDEAESLYRRAASMGPIEVVGLDCHIGSQLTGVGPFLDALERLLGLVDRLAVSGLRLRHLDLGGGLGIRYRDEFPPTPAELVGALLRRLQGVDLEVLIEPGRAVVGPAGVLLTRVEYVKRASARDFVVVDAAMNDLLRPALYGAWHPIVPVTPRPGPGRRCDVVGPVCETGDFLGKDRSLDVEPGDLLAVESAGAYGFAMSSSYNSRPRGAEVLVDGDRAYLVRRRESVADLLAGERGLPEG